MQNREELRQKRHDKSFKKLMCCMWEQNIIFRGEAGNIIFAYKNMDPYVILNILDY
jgi:hypothetical protein